MQLASRDPVLFAQRRIPQDASLGTPAGVAFPRGPQLYRTFAC